VRKPRSVFRLFPAIRQSLLSEGKTVKYLKYAFGEVLLVVAGILIALSVNNWNEERKLELDRLELIENLKADFRMNLERLEEVLTTSGTIVDGLEVFLELAGKESREFSKEELRSHSRYAFRAIYFEPAMSAYDAALATGLIYTIPNRSLNGLIAKFDHDYQVYKVTQTQEIHDQFSGTISQLRASLGSLHVFDDDLIAPERFQLSEDQYYEVVSRKDVYAAFEAKHSIKSRQNDILKRVEETTKQILSALESL
jgi:hypothetical protein